jgi:hypothetical protein
VNYLFIFTKCIDAEIVVKNDFLLHDAPNEIILPSPPTRVREKWSRSPCSTTTVVMALPARQAMFCVRAKEFVPLYCHGDDRDLDIASCRDLNKAIHRRRCVTIRPAEGVLVAVGKSIRSLLGHVLYFDSVQLFLLA